MLTIAVLNHRMSTKGANSETAVHDVTFQISYILVLQLFMFSFFSFFLCRGGGVIEVALKLQFSWWKCFVQWTKI